MEGLPWNRRIIIILIALIIHAQNYCIAGLCEPLELHKKLVSPKFDTYLFTIAMGMILTGFALCPTMSPYNTLPQCGVMAIQVYLVILLSNLALRLIWLPFSHIFLKQINVIIASLLNFLNKRSKKNVKNSFLANAARKMDSPAAVQFVSSVFAFLFLVLVIYGYFKNDINRMIRSLTSKKSSSDSCSSPPARRTGCSPKPRCRNRSFEDTGVEDTDVEGDEYEHGGDVDNNVSGWTSFFD